MPDHGTPRVVLIEGVECAGKSTLIRALRHDIGWDCKALSHRPGDQFDRFMREYILGHDLIFNRGHYSEIVYSQLWGREIPFSDPEKAVLTDYVSRHVLLVHCTADVDTLKIRYERRNYQQHASNSELARICDLFDQVLLTVPHLRYVSTDEAALTEMVIKIQRSLQTLSSVS